MKLHNTYIYIYFFFAVSLALFIALDQQSDLYSEDWMGKLEYRETLWTESVT